MIRQAILGAGLAACLAMTACGAGKSRASSPTVKAHQRPPKGGAEQTIPGADLASVVIQLETLRSQIRLYNMLKADTPYNKRTSPRDFWGPLIREGLLQGEPTNPLQHSARVGSKPARGVGWVWAEKTPGNPKTLNLYAVDHKGGWFDEEDITGMALRPPGGPARR